MTKVIKEAWTDLSHEAKELVLHGDNSQQLEYQSKQPIMMNLAKKHAKGIYDPVKAKKLWGYHADRCALDYCKQFGGKDDKWHEMFKPTDRREAAAHWEQMHRDEIKEDTMTGNEGLQTIFEAILEKKPLEISEEFDVLMKQKIADLINTKKQELAEVVFLSGEQIEEAKKKKKKKKKGEKEVSNAIHASIHADDKTGMKY